jgi:WD40 repeat protein
VAALAGLVLLVGAVGLGGVFWQWRIARQSADAQAYEAYTAKIALAASKIESRAFPLASKTLDSCLPTLRHWEWGWLKQVCDAAPRMLGASGDTVGGRINYVAFSSDGRQAFIALAPDTRLWNLESNSAIGLFEMNPSGEPRGMPISAGFSQVGKQVFLATDRKITFWKSETGEWVREFRPPDKQFIESVSRHGEVAAAAQQTNAPPRWTLWDTTAGRQIATINAAGVAAGGRFGYRPSAVLSSDGRRILTEALNLDSSPIAGMKDEKMRGAVVGRSFRWQVWDTQTAQLLWERPEVSSGFDLATFSPDGLKLFTRRYSAGQSEATVWAADSGFAMLKLGAAELGLPKGQDDLQAAFSADGERLLVIHRSDRGSAAEVWSVRGGQRITSFQGHTDSVYAMAFSPDGQRVITAGDRVAKLWDATTGRELKTIEGHLGRINCTAFSPDGQRALTGSTDKTVLLSDLRPERVPLRLPKKAHPAVFSRWASFSADGRMVMAAGWEAPLTKTLGTIKVWDAISGREQATLSTSNVEMMIRAALSPDGSYLVGVGNRVAQVWDLSTGRELRRFTADFISVSPEASKVFGLQVEIQTGVATVKVWQAATGSLLATHTVTNSYGYSGTAFSQDGQFLRRNHLGLQLVEPESGKIIGQSKNEAYSVEVFSAVRRALAVEFFYAGPPPQPASVRLSFIDLQRGRKTIVPIAREQLLPQSGAAPTPDSPLLPPEVLCVSADGSRVALHNIGRTGNNVRIFDTGSGHELVELIGHTAAVESAAFFPDGLRIVTGSQDHTAKLWDTHTGRELVSLAHPDTVRGVAVSPDEERLFTICQNGAATIWPAREWKTSAKHASTR